MWMILGRGNHVVFKLDMYLYIYTFMSVYLCVYVCVTLYLYVYVLGSQ
jgi:hypothetical protein